MGQLKGKIHVKGGPGKASRSLGPETPRPPASKLPISRQAVSQSINFPCILKQR